MFWFRPNDNTNAHLDTFPMRQISHPGARSRQWTQSFPSTIIGPAALFPPSPSYSCVPFCHLYPFSIVIAFAITVILYCSLVMLTSKSGPVRPIGRRPDLTGPSQILCYIWFPNNSPADCRRRHPSFSSMRLKRMNGKNNCPRGKDTGHFHPSHQGQKMGIHKSVSRHWSRLYTGCPSTAYTCFAPNVVVWAHFWWVPSPQS